MTEDKLLEVGDVLRWTEDSIPNMAIIVRVTAKTAYTQAAGTFKRKAKYWNGVNSDNGFCAESRSKPVVRYGIKPKL